MSVRKLRAVRSFCLLLAISACWLVAHLGRPKNNSEFGPLQQIIVLAAAYYAVSGFTFQRFINKERPRSHLETLRRWSAGHMARLLFPASAAAWGDVLRMSSGALWLA